MIGVDPQDDIACVPAFSPPCMNGQPEFELFFSEAFGNEARKDPISASGILYCTEPKACG